MARGRARRHGHRRLASASCPASSRRPTSSASTRIGPIRSTAASATRSRGARSSATRCSTRRPHRRDRHTAPGALRAIYDAWYLPIAVTMWVLGALGLLPRVRGRRKARGTSGGYFYGSVWAVCIAQPVLWLLWKALPHGRVVRRRSSWSIFWASARVRRQPRAARSAAAHASDPAGRAGRLRLTSGRSAHRVLSRFVSSSD